MQAYATVYPWIVMFLASISSIGAVVGGIITGWVIASTPKDAEDSSRATNLWLGFATFVFSGVAAMLILRIGAWAVGV